MVKGATVRVSGAGVRRKAKTNAKGQTTLTLRLRRGGRVRFTATRKGYATGGATAVVLGS